MKIKLLKNVYLNEPYNLLEVGSVHTISAKIGQDLINKNYADLIVEPAPPELSAPSAAKRRRQSNAKAE